MQESHHSNDPEADWSRLAPVLDEAMHELAEADRIALLLRHFQQRPVAEVGARLGLGENAARMRVERALDRLRGRLAKRGITSTGSALALALGGPAVVAAPAGLATNIAAGAVAAGALTASTFGLLSFMASTKLKIGDGTTAWTGLSYTSLDWTTLAGKPAVIAAGATQEAARAAISAAALDGNGDIPRSQWGAQVVDGGSVDATPTQTLDGGTV
jgi:hypothetical protein